MFAIGHFALGYILGKGTSKLAQVKVNLPLLFAASVLPDVDLILRFLMHRGPTHSLITITVLMIPFFAVYRKQALPYYAALLSHIFIGDFFTGGAQLMWPLSSSLFGAPSIQPLSLTNVIVELSLFSVTLPFMYKLGDLQTLLKPHNKNWVLIIPLVATLGPLLTIGRGEETSLPTLLVIPSLFYVGLFAYSLIVELKGRHNHPRKEYGSYEGVLVFVASGLKARHVPSPGSRIINCRSKLVLKLLALLSFVVFLTRSSKSFCNFPNCFK